MAINTPNVCGCVCLVLELVCLCGPTAAEGLGEREREKKGYGAGVGGWSNSDIDAFGSKSTPRTCQTGKYRMRPQLVTLFGIAGASVVTWKYTQCVRNLTLNETLYEETLWLTIVVHMLLLIMLLQCKSMGILHNNPLLSSCSTRTSD